MSAYVRRTLQYASWESISRMPPGKLIALLLVIVTPGGLAVPFCYAAYTVVRRSLRR
jgi:hypothetical protein